jgi:hypothetical protein
MGFKPRCVIWRRLRYGSVMVKIEVIIGLAASIVGLATFFFRAWANLRAGRRVQGYRKAIGDQSELELQRLRAELEEAQRQLERDRKDS